MKTCVICKQEKELNQFNKNKAKKDGLNTLCRECSQAKSKTYYKDNPIKHKAEVRKRNDRYRNEIRQRIWSYLLQNPCVDCGERDPLVLGFDHVRGNKIDCISHMIRYLKKWSIIEEEITKCEIRCANCHRRKTALDFNWFQGISPGP